MICCCLHWKCWCLPYEISKQNEASYVNKLVFYSSLLRLTINSMNRRSYLLYNYQQFFGHFDWFFEIFASDLLLFCIGWLDGWLEVPTEQVWPHKKPQIFGEKMLRLLEFFGGKNSSPIFSKLVRARDSNPFILLVGTIKPYNLYY